MSILHCIPAFILTFIVRQMSPSSPSAPPLSPLLSLQNRPGPFAYPLPGDGEAVLGPDRRLVALQCGGGN